MTAPAAIQQPPRLADTDATVTTPGARRVPPPPHTLRELRLLKGWSLNELAARSGLVKGTISQIERGRIVATQREADALAAAIGLQPGELQTKPMLIQVDA